MTGTPQWRIAATMRCLDTRCFRAFLVTLTRCTPQYVLDTRDVSKRQRSSVRRDSTGLCSSLSRSNRPNRFLRRPRPTRPITLRATGLPPAPLARTPHGPGCRDVRCHGRDVWPSRLRDVGRQLSISWRRGEFDPKLRFAQSPSHDWPPARPTAHPTWCRSYSRSALGARPRRPVQTLSTPPSTRSENDAAAAPARQSRAQSTGQRARRQLCR